MLIPHFMSLSLCFVVYKCLDIWNKVDIWGSVFFLQCWTPKVNYFAGNSVEWYVSCMLGAWFLSPLLIKMARKASKNFIKPLLGMVFVFIVLELVVRYLVLEKWMLQTSDWFTWLMDVKNPIFVLPLYFFGILMAELLCRGVQVGIKNLVALEEVGLGIVLISIVFLAKVPINDFTDIGIRIIVILGSVLLIMIFWNGNGVVSNKIFRSNVMKCISSYSMEIYFLHYPVFQIFINVCHFEGMWLILYTVGVTMILSIGLKCINDRFVSLCSKRWNWNWIMILK